MGVTAPRSPSAHDRGAPPWRADGAGPAQPGGDGFVDYSGASIAHVVDNRSAVTRAAVNAFVVNERIAEGCTVVSPVGGRDADALARKYADGNAVVNEVANGHGDGDGDAAPARVNVRHVEHRRVRIL